jgi:hypothetical protein
VAGREEKYKGFSRADEHAMCGEESRPVMHTQPSSMRINLPGVVMNAT